MTLTSTHDHVQMFCKLIVVVNTHQSDIENPHTRGAWTHLRISSTGLTTKFMI